jgi:transcriptional regulator EpsA
VVIRPRWDILGPPSGAADPVDMDSSDSNLLDVDTRDRLLLVFESSLQISSSSGFYLWTQGVLQCLIPHEIMICTLGSGVAQGAQTKWYSSSRYFQGDHCEAACDPKSGLIPRLMRDWLGVSRPHFLVSGAMDEEMEQRLIELELRNLVGHGIKGSHPNCSAYFCFCRTTLSRTRRSEHVLDLLMPFIYAVFCRVLAEESAVPDSRRNSRLAITQRELEILHCIRQGQTTIAIAELLALSPFTVKNHVNKIFRKLGVKSRSQAVAHAIYQGILPAPA